MDYEKIYSNIIERSKNRVLEGYSEKHHCVPRCMGGSDDVSNIAVLTAEEHFLCHQLLIRIFPDNHKLIFAAKAMCMSNSGHVRNNKMYGWLRKMYSEATSKSMMGKSPPNKGIPMSDEQKKKCSEARKGKPSPNKGKKMSDEQKKKLSESKSGIKYSPETIAKRISTYKRNREKLAEAGVFRKLSDEHKKKLSESLKGRVAWNTGVSFSDDSKRKMSEAQKGKKLSPESIAKRTATRKKNGLGCSKETRNKISEAQKGKKLSPEHIANREESRKRNRLLKQSLNTLNN